MTDILKTWPAFMPPRRVLEVFSGKEAKFAFYYFKLGRGKPKQTIEHVWFVYRGRIMGKFKVESVECNVGQIPTLRRMDGDPGAFQIPRDAWVAICKGPFIRLKERVYHDSFRGFRYFDFEEWRMNMEALIP
jgi:hypothetical protein